MIGLLTPQRWRIVVERGVLHATIEKRGVAIWSGSRPYEPEQIADTLGELIAESPLRPAPTTAEIRIAPPLLQRRILADLPPVRRRALQGLISHQPSRFFRQNGHALVTDAAWLRTPRGEPRAAQVVAIDELLVAEVLEGSERAGLRVVSVQPAAIDDSSALDLFPPQTRARRDRDRGRASRRLGLIVAVLWCTIGAVALVRFVRERQRVDAELARLAAPLAALLAARREMGKAQDMLSLAARTDAERSTIPALLRSIVLSLPDSSFLTTLTLDRAGSGILTGAARRPLEVLGRLERTPGVASPHLEGSTVRDLIADQPWERFTIVVGGPAR